MLHITTSLLSCTLLLGAVSIPAVAATGAYQLPYPNEGTFGNTGTWREGMCDVVDHPVQDREIDISTIMPDVALAGIEVAIYNGDDWVRICSAVEDNQLRWRNVITSEPMDDAKIMSRGYINCRLPDGVKYLTIDGELLQGLCGSNKLPSPDPIDLEKANKIVNLLERVLGLRDKVGTDVGLDFAAIVEGQSIRVRYSKTEGCICSVNYGSPISQMPEGMNVEFAPLTPYSGNAGDKQMMAYINNVRRVETSLRTNVAGLIELEKEIQVEFQYIDDCVFAESENDDWIKKWLSILLDKIGWQVCATLFTAYIMFLISKWRRGHEKESAVKNDALGKNAEFSVENKLHSNSGKVISGQNVTDNSDENNVRTNDGNYVANGTLNDYSKTTIYKDSVIVMPEDHKTPDFSNKYPTPYIDLRCNTNLKDNEYFVPVLTRAFRKHENRGIVPDEVISLIPNPFVRGEIRRRNRNVALKRLAGVSTKRVSTEDAIESVKKLMSTLHFKAVVGLGREYEHSAKDATLQYKIRIGSIDDIGYWDFGNVKLHCNSDSNLNREYFRERIPVRMINKQDIASGAEELEDIFLVGKNGMVEDKGSIDIWVEGDFKRSETAEYSVVIRPVSIDLYASSFDAIAWTLNSLDDFDTWQKFLCEKYLCGQMQSADTWDKAIIAFAKDRFGYQTPQ